MKDREISRLKAQISELESRLTIAHLSANQVWWEWDIRSGLLSAHSERECILGYNMSNIKPHYDFWFEAVHPEDRQLVEASLRDHHEGMTEFWAIEHRYRDPNGEYKWVLNAGKVVRYDPDGNPLRMIGITQRIHERKLEEMALMEKNKLLNEVVKKRDFILAAASHDMKNTLSGALGLIDILRSEHPELESKTLALVENSLNQSIQLVNSIHELANSEISTKNKTSFDLNRVLNEVMDKHSLFANKKGISIEINCSEDIQLETERFLVFRILDNLVDNAIKFTQRGWIIINAQLNEAEILIEVSDTGSGIPEEKRGALFTPFSKFSANPEGSGLGLSICRNLSRRIGGEISYRPNNHTGSVFTLKLPLSLLGIREISSKRQADHSNQT